MTGRAIVLRGDAAHLPLPDASVDLIVTSPPYFGLRSYTDGGEHYDGQIGSEATPREYVDALLTCTREWMRVLKPTGSLFVNLGDKYSQRVAARPSSHQDGLFPDRPELQKDWKRDRAAGLARMPYENVINDDGGYVREKSLIGLPWRYAIPCIDDLGLILRAEILWSKPNGLPESVNDRVRRSHEQIFHFTMQPRYFSAVDEIREVSSGYQRPNDADRGRRGAPVGQKARTMADTCNPLGKLPSSVWEIPTAPLTVPASLGIAHFAAYPPELVRRIVQGWSPSGICTACGEGLRPVTSAVRTFDGEPREDLPAWADPSAPRRTPNGAGHWRFRTDRQHLGYACGCPSLEASTIPAVVLDPFGGTGTTALVAAAFGRTGIVVDRSADYCRLAQWRTSDPGERARVLGVAKPPAEIKGQDFLFDLEAS